MKKAVILSVALAALAAGGAGAQEAEPAATTDEVTGTQEIDDAEVAALMAPVGGMTPGSMSGRLGNSLREAVASQVVNDQLVQIPGVRERVRERFRKELPTQYPDLGEVVGLTPTQMENLFDLLARQADEAMTSTAAAEDRVKNEEAQIAKLLGNQYGKWQAYKVELPARLQVRDLDSALIAYDLGLSDAQTGQLITALTAVHTTAGPGIGSFNAESKRMFLDAAAPHISPEQLEVYQKVLDRYSTRARSQGR